MLKLSAVILVLEYKAVKLLLSQERVPKLLPYSCPWYGRKVAEVRGHVHNSGVVRQHRQESIAHILQAPVINLQGFLYLTKMFSWILYWVEKHGRIVDQNVYLSMLLKYLVS